VSYNILVNIVQSLQLRNIVQVGLPSDKIINGRQLISFRVRHRNIRHAVWRLAF
jgi:hypothetical protein